MKPLILLTPAAQTGEAKAETADETITRLTGELASARALIARYENADADRAETEKIVLAKMALGLTRQQALTVIERQKAHDQAVTIGKPVILAAGKGKTHKLVRK